MKIEKAVLYTDGASRGNPGPAAIGAVIRDSKGVVLARISRRIGKTTNNQAEYHAVIAALSNSKITSVDESIDICSDSQLIINQLNRRWNIKEDHLRKLAEQIWLLCKDLKVRFFWVPNNQAGHILG